MTKIITQENRNFNKLDLHDVNFKDANLKNAQFQESTLEGCDFTGCNLHNVKFTDCKIASCKFDYSNLLWAQFEDCEVEKCTFTGADLIGVKGLDVSQVQRELAGQTGRHSFRIALYIDGSRKPSVIKEFTAPIVPDGTLCPTAHELFIEFVPSGDGNFKGQLEDSSETCGGVKIENGLVVHKWTARLELRDNDLWLHKSYWTEIGPNYTSWVWQSDRFVK
jgi:hypothetical protein